MAPKPRDRHDAEYPVGKGYQAKFDANSPAFNNAKGGRVQPASHGVGGGVVSKKKPDMAASMKRMLRRK